MAREVVVDVAAVGASDLCLVDALARLALACCRAGAQVRLRNASDDLVRLIDLAGLTEVLSVERRGQAEAREQRGVEEVVDVRDAAR